MLLKEALQLRGVNVDWLIQRHKIHYSKCEELKQLLVSRGLDVRMVDRESYDEAAVDWADIVVTAGGDGTLLLGASKIRSRNKVIVGVNTDPEYSYGYLCLPNRCTWDLSRTLDLVLTGSFSILWRNRIRVKLTHHRDAMVHLRSLERAVLATSAANSSVSAADLWPESSSDRLSAPSNLLYRIPPAVRSQMVQTTLPVVALNEVYAGDSLSARVSQYEISVDQCPSMRQKSSGVLVVTGTGSTSWYRTVSALPAGVVSDVLQIYRALTTEDHMATYHARTDPDPNAYCSAQPKPQPVECGIMEDSAAKVAEMYNSSLRFEPSDSRMAFVVRDPLCNAVFNVDRPRGFGTEIQIRSLMLDAHLVFDGGYTCPFPYGSVAEFSIDPADALCCIQL